MFWQLFLYKKICMQVFFVLFVKHGLIQENKKKINIDTICGNKTEICHIACYIWRRFAFFFWNSRWKGNYFLLVSHLTSWYLLRWQAFIYSCLLMVSVVFKFSERFIHTKILQHSLILDSSNHHGTFSLYIVKKR